MGDIVTGLNFKQGFLTFLFWVHWYSTYFQITHDIFLFTNGNQCSFADDNTLYAININLLVVKPNPKTNFAVMQRWFYANHTVLNTGKYHYTLIGYHNKPDKINLNGTETKNSNNDNLGVLFDKKLSFDVHLKFKKPWQKLVALPRISVYLTLDQKLLLISSVIKLQYSYFPLSKIGKCPNLKKNCPGCGHLWVKFLV